MKQLEQGKSVYLYPLNSNDSFLSLNSVPEVHPAGLWKENNENGNYFIYSMSGVTAVALACYFWFERRENMKSTKL